MLGKRGGAWIVVTPGCRPKVLAVHDSRVRTVWKHTYDESDTHYTLAKGGSLVAQWSFDRGGATAVAVFDLTGKVVAHRNWGGTVRLLDFLGDRLLISTRTKTQTWTVPGKPVSAGPDAWFGDLDADLLFVNVPADSVGPTSLSAPGTPTWSSGTFVPPVPAFKADFDAALGWEPDGSLLVQVKSGPTKALVRCTMARVCERATPWVKGRHLGFPL